MATGRTFLAALAGLLGLAPLCTMGAPASAQPRSDEGQSGGAMPTPTAKRPHRFGFDQGASGPRTTSADSAKAVSVKRAPNATGPAATLAGFRLLDGGTSRVYVELTAAVEVLVKTGPGTVVYTLKGVTVPCKNNRNPLITTHFAGPVARVQLVPNGRDTDVVIELRAVASPTHRIVGESGSGARLEVDFPPPAPQSQAALAPASASASASASVAASASVVTAPRLANASEAPSPRGGGATRLRQPARSLPPRTEPAIPDSLPNPSKEP